MVGSFFTNFIMKKISYYTVSNKGSDLVNGHVIDSKQGYTAGESQFIINYGDIADGIQTIGEASIENTSIVKSAKVDNDQKTITLIPGDTLKTPCKTYKTNISYDITFNESKTVKYYSKIEFYVEINDTDCSCVMTSHNGRLSASEYLASHKGEENDLDSIVTKKGLISNLKEFASQVSTKIGATSSFSINYDLDGDKKHQICLCELYKLHS